MLTHARAIDVDAASVARWLHVDPA